MYKLEELNKTEYDKYVVKHKKAHFLESSSWGDFSQKKKHFTTYYMGLYKDKELVGATLLLKKSLPMGYSYFYSPRGFVVDYDNKDLVEAFTKEVINFTKKHKSIFFKIDPDIIRKSINFEEKENELNTDPNKVFDMLKSLGYKHLGFTKNFETNEPR